jgi:hypothetical protein
VATLGDGGEAWIQLFARHACCALSARKPTERTRDEIYNIAHDFERPWP